MAKLNFMVSLHIFLRLLFTVLLCSLPLITNSKQTKRSGGLQFRLINIASLNSPIHKPELTKSRTHYPSKNTTLERFNKYNGLNPVTIDSKQLTYYVSLGLGLIGNRREYQNIFLVLDTGSDYMWTQCQGCRMCIEHLTVPDFKRSESQTFTPWPCNHCQGGPCYEDHCQFQVNYADGSAMRGFWAHETLTFASNMFDEESIHEFNFVCGIEIEKFIPGYHQENVISGVLGLGRGPYSLMSQLAARRLGNLRFSYCLRLPNNQPELDRPIILRFGDSIQSVSGMYMTPLFMVSTKPYYYLNLIDISVNDKALNLQSDFLAVRNDHSGGTVIDSGSAVSYLVTSAYHIFLQEIYDYMDEHNPSLRWYEAGENTNEACWEPSHRFTEVKIPTFTFHFANGVDIFVDTYNVFTLKTVEGVLDPGLYCLSVHETKIQGGTNVIGAIHQINQLLIYDVGQSQLFLRAVDCRTISRYTFTISFTYSKNTLCSFWLNNCLV